MSPSTKFLLLAIIGLAIAIIGSHFLTMLLAVVLMVSYYVIPLLVGLGLLLLAWQIILRSEQQHQDPQVPAKRKNPPQLGAPPSPRKSGNPNPNTEIERELNRLKHQIGQFTKHQHNQKP